MVPFSWRSTWPRVALRGRSCGLISHLHPGLWLRRGLACGGLNNIRFVQGSLLEAKALVGGDFDYVDCCGVLHHLDAPEAGLAALKAVLKPAGGMGVMGLRRAW